MIASGTPDKLPVELDTLLPLQSTSLVSLFVDSLSLSEVLLESRKDALAKKGLLAPSCVVCVDNSRVFLPITNSLVEPVTLPKGFVAAFLGMATNPEIMATLDPTSPGTLSHSEARIRPDLDGIIATTLCKSIRRELLSLLETYSGLFDADTPPLGVVPEAWHRINTRDALPLRQRPYRVLFSERRTTEKEVNKMLSKDIIRPSSNSWSSPVVLVAKKDGFIRFCIDYRRLNKITRKVVHDHRLWVNTRAAWHRASGNKPFLGPDSVGPGRLLDLAYNIYEQLAMENSEISKFSGMGFGEH